MTAPDSNPAASSENESPLVIAFAPMPFGAKGTSRPAPRTTALPSPAHVGLGFDANGRWTLGADENAARALADLYARRLLSVKRRPGSAWSDTQRLVAGREPGGDVCALCGKTVVPFSSDWTLRHVVSPWLGGYELTANRMVCCRACVSNERPRDPLLDARVSADVRRQALLDATAHHAALVSNDGLAHVMERWRYPRFALWAFDLGSLGVIGWRGTSSLPEGWSVIVRTCSPLAVVNGAQGSGAMVVPGTRFLETLWKLIDIHAYVRCLPPVPGAMDMTPWHDPRSAWQEHLVGPRALARGRGSERQSLGKGQKRTKRS